MAVPVSSSPNVGEEMDLEEVILELHSQLQQSNQVHDLKEKFLICKSMTYSLAKQLQKYQCNKDNDLIVSALGEKMQSHDGELAERLTVEEQLRESNIIHHQIQELSELRNRECHGKNVSLLIREHLWELLTLHSSDSHKLRELLVSMYKLADHLILKLSPENGAEEESGKEDESLALR
ncbi:putative neuroblastoma breakpoint family member 5 [Sciurus carolinensis]|uniref:putative neuroblastoma breakpoint family member 5 n=1 Tax=Sciurus carolinensis TaxID=30640 RepID=UPI001FB301D1|nr:putative neuroblastoma breakpoint family member 5 [Sciurus carolinensis]XP_047394708.1 putative neuroblastoma breakpoint family member 5 [Sciurus carolinensis]XP_047395342.1 putative neuroblastoma breakpoint family member 5 [Sciurus carolinensis]